jgi:hypothetical protein
MATIEAKQFPRGIYLLSIQLNNGNIITKK